nr:glycosyltransferase family 1 protein [uncultured Blautia sp.]
MNTKRRIGIDLSFVRPDHKNGGTETYVKNLMHGFETIGVCDDIVYFIHEDIYRDYKKEYPKSKFIIYKGKGNHKLRMIMFQTFMLPKLVKKYGVKLVYEPTYTSGLRLKCDYFVVSNPEDLQFKFYPEYFGKIRWWYINIMMWITFRKSDCVIAFTEYVEKTLHQFYHKLLKGKTKTLYLPIRFILDGAGSEKVDGIDYRYVLSVNALRKNKNLITLLKAFEKIADKVEEKLVFAGIKQDDADSLLQYVETHNLKDKVVFLDFITDIQLKWLFENASVFVTPSLYEGFGMSPVEAMGYGCPTISSMETSLKEVTEGRAIYYEPAKDYNVLADKIEKVLNNKILIDIQANKDAMRKKYEICTVSKDYYDFFRKIIEEKRTQ